MVVHVVGRDQGRHITVVEGALVSKGQLGPSAFMADRVPRLMGLQTLLAQHRGELLGLRRRIAEDQSTVGLAHRVPSSTLRSPKQQVTRPASYNPAVLATQRLAPGPTLTQWIPRSSLVWKEYPAASLRPGPCRPGGTCSQGRPCGRPPAALRPGDDTTVTER
jgi:hypothetical protein